MDVSSSSIYWPFLGKPRLTDLCQMMHHPNYTMATSRNTQNTNWHIYKVLIRENSQQFIFQTLSNRHFENTLPQHDLVIYSWYWQLQNVITNLMDGAFMTVGCRCSSPSCLHPPFFLRTVRPGVCFTVSFREQLRLWYNSATGLPRNPLV